MCFLVYLYYVILILVPFVYYNTIMKDEFCFKPRLALGDM